MLKFTIVKKLYNLEKGYIIELHSQEKYPLTTNLIWSLLASYTNIGDTVREGVDFRIQGYKDADGKPYFVADTVVDVAAALGNVITVTDNRDKG